MFNDPATTVIYTLSLHDALPISSAVPALLAELSQPTRDALAALSPLAAVARLQSPVLIAHGVADASIPFTRSEEHTSELQSRRDLVCRLLLEKKNTTKSSQSVVG